jgi:hypothetical protein
MDLFTFFVVGSFFSSSPCPPILVLLFWLGVGANVWNLLVFIHREFFE